MNTVSTATTSTLRRYLLPATTGSHPASVLWLMMPICPAPFGTSHTMTKKATSCVAT